MKRTPFAHILVLITFLFNSFGPLPLALADDFSLPTPGVMVRLSPPLDPPILKGIKVNPEDPFRFEFILNKGDNELSNDQLKDESSKLIKYFLASLTIPEKDLWVNLSPYERDRIIPSSFGLTEMGRDLLAEDYMLKQITASLIYPEDETGKKFWKRIYQEAQEKFGTTNIPVNTFNKVWIVPEKAVVYENAKTGTAYVVESKLKVMLEQDYLSLEKHSTVTAVPQTDVNALGSKIVREIVIPELTKEVNEGKNFAKLRQVFNSLILATWYKKKIKDSILEQVYANKNKIKGLSFPNASLGNPEYIYQQYLKAFKKGVYNYIKEEIDPATQETIPRKYFSGGVTVLGLSNAMVSLNKPSQAMLGELDKSPAMLIDAAIETPGSKVVTTSSASPVVAPRMTTIPERLVNSTEAIKEELVDKPNAVVWDIGMGWRGNDGPVTVKELADALPDQRVIAIDNQIPAYQVQFDKGLETVLFDENGKVLSYQSRDRFHSEATLKVEQRKYFHRMFQHIRAQEAQRVSYALGFEGRDLQIESNPIRLHQRDNLQYLKADLFNLEAVADSLQNNKADIVRIANVLIPYYAPADIQLALRQLLPFVNDGGKVFIGWSHTEHQGEDYLVYQKQGNSFQLAQYAFGMDSEFTVKFGSGLSAEPIESPATRFNDDLLDFVRASPEWSAIRQFIVRNTGIDEEQYAQRKPEALVKRRRMMEIARDGLQKAGVASQLKGTMLFIDMNALPLAQSALGRKIDQESRQYFIDKGVPFSVNAQPATEKKFVSAIASAVIAGYRGNRFVSVLVNSHLRLASIFAAGIIGFDPYEEVPKLAQLISPLLLSRIRAKSNRGAEVSLAMASLNHEKASPAMMHEQGLKNTGGIDLTSNKFLQIQNGGEAIKFHLDPAMLAQLQNAPGFVPVIINIQPMTNLRQFLGIDAGIV